MQLPKATVCAAISVARCLGRRPALSATVGLRGDFNLKLQLTGIEAAQAATAQATNVRSSM